MALASRIAVAALLAIGATLVSLAVRGKVRAAYLGLLDCAQSCDYVAAGWPFPWLVDHPGISSTASVSPIAGLFGGDLIWLDPLAATFLFWLCAFAAFACLFEWLRRRRRAHRSVTD